VDVGASLGIYTLISARLVGDAGQVLAFEPARETFGMLRRNVLLNQLPNVRLFNCAVGDEGGVRRLYQYPDPGRNSLGAGVAPAVGMEDVAMTTLDLALAREGFAQLDLIKADVEGAEELVFRGARNILSTRHPMIIFEINPAAAEGLGLAPLGAWQLLEGMGYQFWRLDSPTNLRRLASPPAGGNVVAIHRSA
jgi:FkbM family methyltransferase